MTVYRCVDVIVLCRLVWRERWSIDRNLTWRRIKEARQKGWREEGKNLKTLCLGDAILSFLAPATAERTPRSTYFKWQKASLFRAPRFIPFPLSPSYVSSFSSSICTAVSNFNYPHPRGRKKRGEEKGEENHSPKISRTTSKSTSAQPRKNHSPRTIFDIFRVNFFPLPPLSPWKLKTGDFFARPDYAKYNYREIKR